jgi:hypothetical protein
MKIMLSNREKTVLSDRERNGKITKKWKSKEHFLERDCTIVSSELRTVSAICMGILRARTNKKHVEQNRIHIE